MDMQTFADLIFTTKDYYSGKWARLFFGNGYGVSVIIGPYSYGWNEWLYELAILKWVEGKSNLCYDTPITSDVMGHRTSEEITEIMKLVQELPSVKQQPYDDKELEWEMV